MKRITKLLPGVSLAAQYNHTGADASAIHVMRLRYESSSPQKSAHQACSNHTQGPRPDGVACQLLRIVCTFVDCGLWSCARAMPVILTGLRACRHTCPLGSRLHSPHRAAAVCRGGHKSLSCTAPAGDRSQSTLPVRKKGTGLRQELAQHGERHETESFRMS